MNKKLIFPVLALAVIGFGIFGTGITLADKTNSSRESIVQRLAERFGLNENEVQKVFDEVRNERLAEMQTKQEERLTKLVSDGKITKEQKTLILNKQKEFQESRNLEKASFIDFAPNARKSQMEVRKTELEDWASENNIDLQYLMYIGGRDQVRTDFTLD